MGRERRGKNAMKSKPFMNETRNIGSEKRNIKRRIIVMINIKRISSSVDKDKITVNNR